MRLDGQVEQVYKNMMYFPLIHNTCTFLLVYYISCRLYVCLQICTLQHFAEGWETFSEKVEDRPCIDRPKYTEMSPGIWKGPVYSYSYTDVVIKSFKCVSVLGFAKTLIPGLLGGKKK